MKKSLLFLPMLLFTFFQCSAMYDGGDVGSFDNLRSLDDYLDYCNPFSLVYMAYNTMKKQTKALNPIEEANKPGSAKYKTN